MHTLTFSQSLSHSLTHTRKYNTNTTHARKRCFKLCMCVRRKKKGKKLAWSMSRSPTLRETHTVTFVLYGKCKLLHSNALNWQGGQLNHKHLSHGQLIISINLVFYFKTRENDRPAIIRIALALENTRIINETVFCGFYRFQFDIFSFLTTIKHSELSFVYLLIFGGTRFCRLVVTPKWRHILKEELNVRFCVNRIA